MIFGVTGPIGGGKTYYGVQFALNRCNDKRMYLITNQPLDLKQVRLYATAKKLNWLIHLLEVGGIRYLDYDSCKTESEKALYFNQIYELLRQRNTVSLIDEVAIFFPYRINPQRPVPRDFYSDLILSRKLRNDIIWIAQDYNLIDPTFFRLTEFVTHCTSTPLFGKLEVLSRNTIPALKYAQWVTRSRGFVSSFFDYSSAFSAAISSPKIFNLYNSYSTLGAISSYRYFSEPLTVKPVTPLPALSLVPELRSSGESVGPQAVAPTQPVRRLVI